DARDRRLSTTCRAASAFHIQPRLAAQSGASHSSDGLPGFPGPDVRKAARHLERIVPAEPRACAAEYDLVARHQSRIHRGLYGWAQSRVREGIAVARVSDRSTRQLLPAVLGCEGN